MKFFLFSIFFALSLFFSACSNYANTNADYEKMLISQKCDFKIENINDDPIYKGLNTASLARVCKDFQTSNELFDKSEEAYKFDVDLQNNGEKIIKNLSEILLNDTINQYQGYFYERIMLNTYKGLNYMSLNDFASARVEFNRVLFRQDRMKEYFYKNIQKLQEKYQENLKKDYALYSSFYQNLDPVLRQYDNLLQNFHANKNFVNVYASYASAVFFFLDKDYIKAYELLKEVSLSDTKNKELTKELKIFENFTRLNNPLKNQKYIFLIYENGFSVNKEEFRLSLPFVFKDNISNINVAFAYLKERKTSFDYLTINQTKTQEIANLDEIILSEFRTLLPTIIMKTLASSALKASINLAIANNDENGIVSFLSIVASSLINKADLRMWQALPKNVSVLMVKNEGEIQINDSLNRSFFEEKTDKNKNYIFIVRSFTPYSSIIYKITD